MAFDTKRYADCIYVAKQAGASELEARDRKSVV